MAIIQQFGQPEELQSFGQLKAVPISMYNWWTRVTFWKLITLHSARKYGSGKMLADMIIEPYLKGYIPTNIKQDENQKTSQNQFSVTPVCLQEHQTGNRAKRFPFLNYFSFHD